MKTFAESAHPRVATGQFKSKHNTEPASGLVSSADEAMWASQDEADWMDRNIEWADSAGEAPAETQISDTSDAWSADYADAPF